MKYLLEWLVRSAILNSYTLLGRLLSIDLGGCNSAKGSSGNYLRHSWQNNQGGANKSSYLGDYINRGDQIKMVTEQMLQL